MKRLYLSESNKDRILNLLLVLSLVLFVTGFVKRSVPKNTDPPSSTSYTTRHAAPASLGNPARFSYMQPIEDSEPSTYIQAPSNQPNKQVSNSGNTAPVAPRLTQETEALTQPLTQITQRPVTGVLNSVLNTVNGLL